MHGAAANYRADHLDLLDGVGIDLVGILREHNEIGQLAGLDRALEVLFERCVGAVDGADFDRLVDGFPVLYSILR